MNERHDEVHRHHLQTDGADVPDELRAELLGVAEDLATYSSREELMGVIESAYSLIGRWEDFLAGDGEEQDRHNSAPEIKVGQVWRDKPGNTLNGVPAIHDWEITSVGRTVRARCVDCVDAWNCMGDLESWPDRHVLVNPVEDGEK